MSRDLNTLANIVDVTRLSDHPTPAEETRHAEALLEFASALQRARSFEDGAELSAEAMRLFGDRVEAGDYDLSHKLAESLLVHAGCLDGLGLKRAIDVFTSAAQLYGALAQRDPSRYLVDLAGVSNDFGCCLRERGRPSEALFHAEKSVEMFGLVVADDGAKLHHLAGAKLNLAKIYSMLGRHEDAITANQEGAKMFEALARTLPDHFALAHAEALDDLSIVLSQAGRGDEALELAERIVRLVADLTREAASRYLEPLARVCNNLGRRYAEAGRLNDAIVWARKAVDAFDALARQYPLAFREPAVRARGNLVQYLEAFERDEEAFELLADTLTHAWALGPGLVLALTLREHANVADRIGRDKVALESAIEALRMIAPLWREQPDYLGDLVRNLASKVLDHTSHQSAPPDDIVALLAEISD